MRFLEHEPTRQRTERVRTASTLGTVREGDAALTRFVRLGGPFAVGQTLGS
jgi:hypothetical protein